jgi:hypothetical protein
MLQLLPSVWCCDRLDDDRKSVPVKPMNNDALPYAALRAMNVLKAFSKEYSESTQRHVGPSATVKAQRSQITSLVNQCGIERKMVLSVSRNDPRAAMCLFQILSLY